MTLPAAMAVGLLTAARADAASWLGLNAGWVEAESTFMALDGRPPATPAPNPPLLVVPPPARRGRSRRRDGSGDQRRSGGRSSTSAESQVRVIEALKRWAEDFGLQTDRGIQVFMSAAGLARRVGVEESEVHALLARLQSLSIVAPLDSKILMVKDLRRLGEFARLVAERERRNGENR